MSSLLKYIIISSLLFGYSVLSNAEEVNGEELRERVISAYNPENIDNLIISSEPNTFARMVIDSAGPVTKAAAETVRRRRLLAALFRCDGMEDQSRQRECYEAQLPQDSECAAIGHRYDVEFNACAKVEMIGRISDEQITEEAQVMPPRDCHFSHSEDAVQCPDGRVFILSDNQTDLGRAMSERIEEGGLDRIPDDEERVLPAAAQE